jgi:hypothetical protein
MNTHDIEQLMAYADGELDPQATEAVEQLLQTDAEARAMVERFRQTRADLAPGLDPWLDEPVPQRLIDAIRHHPGPALAAPTLAPVTAPVAAPVAVATPPAAANDRWYWPSLASAASVALVVGLVAGQWWGGSGGSAGGFDTVAQALQTLPSGQVLQAGDTRVMPLASFRAADGQVCREFEQSANGRQAHGIACQNGGQWITRLLLDHGPAGTLDAPPPAFATASGEADAMSAMVDALGLGQALTPQQEEQALREGWAPAR